MSQSESWTLNKLVKYLSEEQLKKCKKQGFIDFPFSVELFCREVDAKIERLEKALEKCKEQRDEELEDNCYEPERPFDTKQSEYNQELQDILDGKS